MSKKSHRKVGSVAMVDGVPRVQFAMKLTPIAEAVRFENRVLLRTARMHEKLAEQMSESSAVEASSHLDE